MIRRYFDIVNSTKCFRSRLMACSLSTILLARTLFFGVSAFAVEPKIVHNSAAPGTVTGGKKKASTITLEMDLVVGQEDGPDEYLFGRISDVTTDSRGNVYVADNGFARVKKFDPDGRFLLSIGQRGEGPGEFEAPSRLTTDAADNLFVAGQGKVVEYDSDGKYVREMKTQLAGVVRGLRIDPRAGLFVSCLEIMDQQILHNYRFDSGDQIRTFCDSYAVGKDVDTRVEQVIAGGTIDLRNGVIYYTQMSPYEIRIYSLAGELLMTVFRENDFRAPSVEYLEDGSMQFHSFAASVSILALDHGRFMNIAIVPTDSEKSLTVLDLFDDAGILIGTHHVPGVVNVRCIDDDRVYAIEADDYPKVTRYHLLVR